MLMVLNLHSFWGYDHGNGVGQAFDFFRESTSICAVNVFLLISGYFGIKWKWRSFYNLVFQIFFYSFGVYGVACAIGAIDFTVGGFLSNVKGLYASWGFITGYVLLYFCSPFLNALVENSSSKRILVTILVIFIAENFICRDCGYMNFGLLYLVGGFLNKTNAIESLKVKSGKWYWITTVLIFVGVYALYNSSVITDSGSMFSSFFGYSYAAPLVILQAVFLFMVFARIHFTSKFVNWCASSCLAIFLIHMHPAIKYIGYYAVTESFYKLHFLQHVSSVVLLIVGVFFGSILIDKIRIIISEFFYYLIAKVVLIMPSKFLSVNTYIPQVLKKLL